MMISKITSALCDKNYRALSACFSKDGVYIDYCPALVGKECYYAYGRETVEMFIRNRFVHEGLEFGSVKIESETKATFFVSYGAPYMYAVAEVEEVDAEGLVLKFVVRPA